MKRKSQKPRVKIPFNTGTRIHKGKKDYRRAKKVKGDERQPGAFSQKNSTVPSHRPGRISTLLRLCDSGAMAAINPDSEVELKN
jgi:hypothetical protein